MNNTIKHLKIQNFKSIKNLELDCSKINLFIGKPNVGKSNILEALSLLGSSSGDKFYSDLIHYESLSNLFYDQDTQNNIFISSDIGYVGYIENNKTLYGYNIFPNNKEEINEEEIINYFLYRSKKTNNYEIPDFIQKIENNFNIVTTYIGLDSSGNNSKLYPDTPVKNYKFKRLTKHDEIFDSGTKKAFLKPPFGGNLLTILQSNKELRQLIAPFFEEYSLKLNLNIAENKISILKEMDGFIYTLPYSLLADTLQRIIFYLAAIISNTDSILLFEEPETSSFPPYISMLANYIMDSDTNQFFITTHSPYLFEKIIENPKANYSVFICDYNNYETIIKRMTKNNIRKLLNYGTEVFFNLEKYAR